MESLNEIYVGKFKILYNEHVVRIENSYLEDNTENMELTLKIFKTITGYKSRRTLESWLKEWKAHNRLYKLGLFRSHTKDCDLEENEKLHRLIAYQILGI